MNNIVIKHWILLVDPVTAAYDEMDEVNVTICKLEFRSSFWKLTNTKSQQAKQFIRHIHNSCFLMFMTHSPTIWRLVLLHKVFSSVCIRWRFTTHKENGHSEVKWIQVCYHFFDLLLHRSINIQQTHLHVFASDTRNQVSKIETVKNTLHALHFGLWMIAYDVELSHLYYRGCLFWFQNKQHHNE